MRLRRLDLIRYGLFTDSSFELSAQQPDLHIVFGPNEAGKSTALAAIEDLLFGVPTRSPYGFQHDYADMRIGAVLEEGVDVLKVARRKGNKDTLLDPSGMPFAGGERVLVPYLAGADRSLFERMFNLNHERLKEGGQAMLDAKDDVGQMLFSAGAGIGDLRGCLDALSSEAERLWGARRAGHRKFYNAKDKLDEAQRALREHSLSANKWQDLKRAHEQAKAAYADVEGHIKAATTERSRLSRIRRVLRNVRRKQELDSELAGLDGVVALPEDAADLVNHAEREGKLIVERIRERKERLSGIEQSLEGLAFDKALVQRADEINHVHERRIGVRRGKSDLPKRQGELDAAERALSSLAAELGWTEADSAKLIQRIPPRPKVTVLRDLLESHGKLEADVNNHSETLRTFKAAYRELRRKLDQTGQPVDVSRLARAIRAVREQGDLTDRVLTAQEALASARGAVKRRLEALNPGGIDEGALAQLAAPARAMVEDFRERQQDCARRLQEKQIQAVDAQQQLNATVAELDRWVQDERTVTNEELSEARHRRDALWRLVKLKHVRGEAIPEDQSSGFATELEDLAGAFEPAIAQADELADRRFDHAEAAGRVTEIKRKIGEHETRLKHERENLAKLEQDTEGLAAEWAAMWAEAPFDPLPVQAMLEWFDAKKETQQAIEERAKAGDGLERARGEENEARDRVLAELVALGVAAAPLGNDNLKMVIASAEEELDLRKGEARERARLEEELKKAVSQKKQGKRNHRLAEKALDRWGKAWMAALGEVGLAKGATPAAVGAQLDIIDQMRETAERIRSLRHDRIGQIKADIADFQQVLGELVGELAEDLVGKPAEEAALALEGRLADAKRDQESQRQQNQEVKKLAGQIRELEDQQRELVSSISHLQSAANVEELPALKEAIEQSDRKRSLERERGELIDKLLQDSDGKTLEALQKECAGADMDKVTAEEQSKNAELAELQAQRDQAREERTSSREAFAAAGGSDAAARAAAGKQEAFAEMQDTAERYVRVKTSVMLLQWAIDRYRREKQAPLLKRAEQLFTTITGGSFASLEVAFDAQDNARLTGVRSGGDIVAVSGMSTGTVDQLYLALRIASVEDYLERAKPLPFVADDLFVNFDDDRAEAGFKLLAELSQKTQVLLFTHHRHLVDLARRSLGSSVGLVSLTELEPGG